MRRFRTAAYAAACIAAAVACVLSIPATNASFSDSQTGTTQVTFQIPTTNPSSAGQEVTHADTP